jgi:hypothetical protein
MPYLNKAVIIAANPFRDYIIAPDRTTKELGDVEFHKEHLTRHGGVFWDLIPMGRRDIPWKYPEIHSGYFYISKPVGKVKYWIEIEYIKRWGELDLNEVKEYIPEPRLSYLQHYWDKGQIYYAILIREIRDLKPERELSDFRLATNNESVRRVQNYAIVFDPGWR